MPTSGRATLAAPLAYGAALWLSANPVPLLAPLTALLVMQTTRYQTLVNGLLRVLSVIAGVLIALMFSWLFGFTWWSLAVIVAASLCLGELLRLGPHAVEVPISAMLVLSLGAGGTAVEGRAVETLVEAGAGVLVNAAIGPPVRLADAGDALEALADQLARLLRTAECWTKVGRFPARAVASA